MKYKVIKDYNDTPEDPIKIFKGEILEFVEESDPSGDWPNWVYCKGDKKEGWIPKQILVVKNKKVISLEDYFAREHFLIKDEIILSEKELNGWIWGNKISKPEELGWAPLNHLQQL